MNLVKSLYFFYFLTKLSTIYYKYFSRVDMQKGVVFRGFSNLILHKTAKLKIGKNTTINSLNYGYHINMYASCKLYLDRPNSSVEIGDNTRIHGTCIHAFNSIKIGDNCLIAANTQIIDGNGHQLLMDAPENRINTSDSGKPIVIEDNVWIAANCTVLGGTTIGEGTVITSGSVVKGVIPARSIYGGNPAKLIKQY